MHAYTNCKVWYACGQIEEVFQGKPHHIEQGITRAFSFTPVGVVPSEIISTEKYWANKSTFFVQK
jgi:hypothetical protein